MATDLTVKHSPLTLDLTGLPEPVVRRVQQLVDEARRQQPAAAAVPTAGAVSPNQADAARWSAEWRAWSAAHPARELTLDDSRESIYAGCGE